MQNLIKLTVHSELKLMLFVCFLHMPGGIIEIKYEWECVEHEQAKLYIDLLIMFQFYNSYVIVILYNSDSLLSL